VKRILILFHQNDRHRRNRQYLIDALGDLWKERGLEVSYMYGTGDRPEADLVIPHIDLTFTPSEYIEYLTHYPNVVNRNVTDISKRNISQYLLREGEDYTGPVIVKTNENYGGIPERRNRGNTYPFPARFVYMAAGRIGDVMRQNLARKRILRKYLLYGDLADVPPQVFRNPALVVERFLPEYIGNRYFTNHYVFLGDHGRIGRASSDEPFVKRENSVLVSDEPIMKKDGSVPENVDPAIMDKLFEMRRRLGFDYGKFDYTIHNGEVIILDVNWTPCIPGLMNSPELAAGVSTLSDGIWSLLERT